MGCRVEVVGYRFEASGFRVEVLRCRAEGFGVRVEVFGYTVEVLGLCRTVERFRGGLVLKAHRLVYHSTLGSRVIKKKKEVEGGTWPPRKDAFQKKGSISIAIWFMV